MDRLFFVILLFGIFNGEVFSTGEVVYAVNSGGPAHTDLNGVHFQADKLTIGTSSDFGKSLSIGRVAPADQILYQTERYHFSNFGYNIPIKENGDYVLILKFCEVYFQGPRLKVSFHVPRSIYFFLLVQKLIDIHVNSVLRLMFIRKTVEALHII